MADVAFGPTPDGEWRTDSERGGRLDQRADPFFYIMVCGREIAMSRDNLRECLDEMEHTQRRRRAERQEPLPTWRDVQNVIGDLLEIARDEKVGRRRYGSASRNATVNA